MSIKHKSTYTMPEIDPAATLAALIRKQINKSQHNQLDSQGSDPKRSRALVFCDETSMTYAIGQFHNHPTNSNFSNALGCLLIQAAQSFVTRLKAVESLKTYWSSTNTSVVIFECAAYIWSMLSFDVRKNVMYEFESDKEAVLGGMLGGFAAAMSMMKNQWAEFSPQAYTLSRIFLYPNDCIKAADRFCRVFLLTEGCILPISVADINKDVDSALNEAECALLCNLRIIHDEVMPRLGDAVSGLVSTYLDHRLD